MVSTYKIVQSGKEFEEAFDFLKSVTKGSPKAKLSEELTPIYKPNFNVLVKQGEDISLYHAFVDSLDELKSKLNEAGFVEDNNLTTGEQP